MRTVIITSVCMVLLWSHALFAEAVFMKNGSIVEGTIAAETDKAITVRVRGRNQALKREDVLRILYSDEYKNRIYLYLRNQPAVQGYIVGETDRHYFFRTQLNSPREKRVSKSDVDIIAAKPVDTIDELYKKGTGGRFNRLFGVQLGIGMHLVEAAHLPENDAMELAVGWTPGILRFFFFDRRFDVQYVGYFGGMIIGEGGDISNGSAMFQDFTVTGYPFKFNIITLGIVAGGAQIGMHDVWFEESSGPTRDEFLRSHEVFGFQVGVAARVKDFLRFSFTVILPFETDTTVESYHNINTVYEEHDLRNVPWMPSFKFSADIFPWKNLAINVEYLLVMLNGDMPTNEYDYSYKEYYEHLFSISVGYGFNL